MESKLWGWTIVLRDSQDGKGKVDSDRQQASRRGGLTLSPSFLGVSHHLSVVDWNTVVVID